VNEEIFTITTREGPVETLGVRVGKHYAWTRALSAGEIPVGKRPSLLTHLPTGLAAAYPRTKKIAEKVAAALEALPIDHGQVNPDLYAEAIVKATAPTNPKAWIVDRLLASREWRGAWITGEVYRRLRDLDVYDCRNPSRCGAAEHYTERVSKNGRDRIVTRCLRDYLCHRVEHPSGATAHVRADA
jgi:hypothetical protein